MLGQIFSLQVGSALAKDAYTTVGPTALAGMRIVFSAAFLWLLVRPRLRQVTARQWRAAISLGLVLAAMNLAYFHAIGHLPLGVAATLELLGPLGLSVLLSRRPQHVMAALLALAGVLLLAAPGASLPAVGVLLGITAAVCRAGYVVLNQRVGRLFSDWTGLTLALACGACVLAPVAAFTDGAVVAAHPAVLGTGAAVALLSSLIPYSLDMTLLRRIDTRTFGVLLALSPAVGAGIGFALLHEQLTVRQLAATALIVVAGAWSLRRASPSGVPTRSSGSPSTATPSDDDHCPFCWSPVSGQVRRWTLRSHHRTSEGEVEYCSGGCGCQVVVVNGEIVKALVRRPQAARIGPQ
ncbi:EamA family transporter [Streptomyces ferrugineus]|uniref:EamA family transporter n=2 Tax=Streptomyces ferrugineus TaxID=1413221 RepID=A0A7M2SY34_9ACTN|nr:EamA family transporter [Streptomyces ferrugineus]